MSDYTSHVSCELWADLDSQLWRSSPSPSCPSNWSKCLVVVGCEMSLASFLAKKCIEFASVGSENAKLLQVAPVLTQTTWKKNVKLKNQKRKRSLNVIEISLRKHLLQFVVQVKWCSNRRRQRQRRGAGTVAILKSLLSNPLPSNVYRLWDSLTALHLALCFAWPATCAANCFSYRFLCVLVLRCFIFYGATEVIDLTKCH